MSQFTPFKIMKKKKNLANSKAELMNRAVFPKVLSCEPSASNQYHDDGLVQRMTHICG
jgi:hypothetical protein